MAFNAERALDLLKGGVGSPGANFRDSQRDAIRHIVEGRGRLLVVQKTGWGKSFVYFIAAKLLREEGAGPALLISPLLSLMRNQIAAAERMGVRAVTINSDNVEDWEELEEKIRSDQVDVLLISPERLANVRFRDQVLATVGGRVSLLVIDEAHCISDWGHDFRPDYRLIERMIRLLPQNIRLLATTATANGRVIDDLQEVLGPELHVIRGDLYRPSLLLQTISLPSQAERLAWLAQNIPYLAGTGIVYTLTKRDAERVADWLRHNEIDAHAYTSDTDSERKHELEEALLANEIKALVATTALGMGYDKPDLHFVIHFQAPGSAVAYYQQVGRAGRGLDAAYGILLSGDEEGEISDFFINRAFPTREEVSLILDALDAAPDGLSIPQLLSRVNVSQGRVEHAIKLLSLESPAPLAKIGTKWQLTATDLSDDFWARAERLTDLRRGEHREMQDYVALESGHMEFLMRVLDGGEVPVTPPPINALSAELDSELVREAETFLRRTRLVIQPRLKWLDGGLPQYQARGSIPPKHRANEGRALCIWRDAGWGGLVRTGKYENNHFSDELVEACVQLYRGWAPEPAPTWVTAIPSHRHPDLVPDFAMRFAERIGLPYRKTLEWTNKRPQQKAMANSMQQARNLDGALGIIAQPDSEPVLLVDDMVDSRWTFTVAAWLLRSNGSGPVWPLALSQV